MSDASNWEKMFHNDKDLAHFLKSMSKFDRLFCDLMAHGDEFTLRLEVKGKGKRLIHCRVGTDEFDRVDEKK